jgi:hypothetical protein
MYIQCKHLQCDPVSTVNFAPMTHFNNHYYHSMVIYSSENSVIPNTIFPQVAQAGSF